MAYLNHDIFDAALDEIINATSKVLYICSTEPTTRTEAVTTYALGNKTGVVVGTKANGDVSGRKCTVSAITDGTVTATGTAGFWAIVDGTRLLVVRALASTQAVTSGNDFSIGPLDITFPDPA